MAKNQQNGLAQNLDSEATKNSQPNKLFIPGARNIPGADPEQPSINNATRREQYAIENQGSTVPESTKIGAYDTVSPVVSTDRGITPDSDSWNQYTGFIKKLKGNSFITEENEKLRQEIEQSLREKGIDTTKEVYGEMMTNYVNQSIQAAYDLESIAAQKTGLEETQAYNIRLIETLVKETYAGLSQGKSIKEIAQALGQDERVIQKIAQGKHAELIQLSQEYEDEQMRSYLRYKEDLDTQIARNIVQYQNAKTNLDYQFNSAMSTLKNSLFDAEWTARGTAAGMGMTGTSYLLDRIQNQYNNQMMDLQNTYDYQSANAQIAINNALEDYTTNVKRYMEDYASSIKEIQGYVRERWMTLSNQMLSAQDQIIALNKVKANVEEMKANAIVSAAAALEDGNTALYNYIQNAYGLEDMTIHQFTNSELGRTSTSTIGNDTNNLGHILKSDDGIRIGTYKSANGYTYNVYATREDGLIATQGLLQRAYYGKTLKQAAQKWIGQGKDISGAISVLKQLGLDPNAILSDENVRKFMEAIGRREGTIKAGETLDDWVKGGKNLSSYGTGTGLVGGEGTTSTGYNENYTEDYDTYLKKGTDGFKKASQDALIQKFGSWDNFVANAKAYQKVKTKQDAATMLDSLKTMQDLRNAWGELSAPQKAELGTIGLTAWGENWLTALSNLGGGDISDVYAKFNTVSAQGFIDTLVQSKKNGAAYGQLSDAEGSKINKARSELTLRNPGKFDNVLGNMISNIYSNLKELGYSDEEISSYLGSTNTQINITSNLSFPNSVATGAGNNVGFVDFQEYNQ